MELLAHLLADDPASPRLTVYNVTAGEHMNFSAETLDNWAAKVGNFLLEELELDAGSTISIALPVGWQAAVIALGAIAARIDFTFAAQGETTASEALFCSPEQAAAAIAQAGHSEVIAVTDDAFGRGVSEIGEELASGAVDFGPTVRFYGDVFPHPTPALAAQAPSDDELPRGARVLSTGWHDQHSFTEAVLEPLAVGGSAVIVSGLTDSSRLEEIAATEKATLLR